MARQGDQYVTQARLRRSQDFVFETVGKWLGQQLAQSLEAYTESKVAPLLRRIEELEQAKPLRDAGVWRHGTRYQIGDVVSHRGTLWSCKAPTSIDAPGDGNTAWRLMVKHAEHPTRGRKDRTDGR